MDIVAKIREKIDQNGLEATAQALGMKPATLANSLGRTWWLAVQKVIDLWFKPIPSKSVCLMLPWYKFVFPKTAFCLLHMVMKHREVFSIQERDGDAMITRSRNHLARRFLRDTQCEWSLWIDDDMVLPSGNPVWFNELTGMGLPSIFAGMDTLPRLLSHDKKLIGALYYDRHGKGTMTAGFDRGLQMNPPHNSIAPVKFIGTGCLLIHRQVYMDIAEKFPETYNPKAPGNECGFFTNMQGKDGRMWGEDEAFGWRALQAGHQTFMDLGLICGHAGHSIYGPPSR